MKRREMGKVKRVGTVNNAHRIGRKDALKKRDMIAASKRRKEKGEKDPDQSAESETKAGP
ncbi:hypothetical protein QCA50_001369 [Cerrena zonata]|uniref:Uncharacterized protein n=1 Tax=Cerrena zonata TaxID=2478898 RepID=A0AAW0GT11_9APHY